jgi:hypothetical protein
MGGSQSTEKNVFSQSADYMNTTATSTTAVVDAMKDGNQLFLRKDVAHKISELSQYFETFNKNDYKGMLSYVDHLNKNLKSGDKPIEISEPIKKALLEFHNAILTNIDKTMLTDEDKNDKFKSIISSKDYDNIFKQLGDHYVKDLDMKKAEILKSKGIVESKEMSESISVIINSVKNLKVKYKFFEYKYIELNIFLILIIQKAYVVIDEFVKNVLDFNSQRDVMREKVLKDTLNIMTSILDAADLQIQPNDFEYLTSMMDKVSADIKEKDETFKQKLTSFKDVANQEILDIVKGMSSTDQDKLLESLQSAKEQRNRQLQGGFLRGQSSLPQAFYDIDKLDSATGAQPEMGAKLL